jgi:hypothetical protein
MDGLEGKGGGEEVEISKEGGRGGKEGAQEARDLVKEGEKLVWIRRK